jgi:hypothetical protein
MALGILAVIIVGEIATPYGLRFELLRLIERSAGASPLNFFLGGFLTSAAITLTGLGFGVVGLLYTMPAFALAPSARGWLRWLALPLWCFLDVFLVRSFWMLSVVRSALPPTLHDHVWEALMVVTLGMSLVLIGLCTGKFRLFIILTGAATASTVYATFMPVQTHYIRGTVIRWISTQGISLEIWPFPFSEFWWSAVAFHVSAAFVLFHWALRERALARRTDCCPKCQYALVGIRSDVCPECGHTLESAPSPIEQREMGEGGVRAT